MITIYHNNRCGKSQEALKLVEASGQEYTVRSYLTEPLTIDELRKLQQFGLPAIQIATKELCFTFFDS